MKTSKQQTWLLVLLFMIASVHAGVTTVSGPISGTQVWSDSIIVNGHIYAANADGDSIRVMPGTVVLVSEGMGFNMNNLILHSEGVDGDSIYFKPLVEGKTWKGFTAYASKTRLILNHTVFEGAYKPLPTGGANPKAHCGGVISLTDVSGRCEIDRCRFSNNGAYDAGGAIYIRNAKFDSEVDHLAFYIYNSVLDNNSAKNNGGAIALEYIKPVHNELIKNCTFTNNEVTETSGAGGGLYAKNCNRLIMTTSTFEKNNGFFSGACQIDSSALVEVDECTFAFNTTGFGVAGAHFEKCDSLLINRTRFNLNNHSGNGVASLTVHSSKGRLVNSIFTDNMSGWTDVKIEECADFDFILLHNTLYNTTAPYPIVYKKASSYVYNTYIYNGSDTAAYLSDTDCKPSFNSCHMVGSVVGPGTSDWTNGGTIFTTKANPNVTTYGFEYGKEPTDNGGSVSGIAMPTVDFYGNPRKINDRYDIGAVECTKYPLTVTHGAASDTIALDQFDSITVPLTITDPYIKDWTILTPTISILTNENVIKSEYIVPTLSSAGSSLRIAAGDIVGKAKVVITVEDHDFPAVLQSQSDTFWVRSADIVPTCTIVHDTLDVEKVKRAETFATFTHGKDTSGINLSFRVDTIIDLGVSGLTKDMVTISGTGLKRTITVSDVPVEGLWKIVTELNDGSTERNEVYDTLICRVQEGIGVITGHSNYTQQKYGLQVGTQFYSFKEGENLAVELVNVKGQIIFNKSISSLNGVINVGNQSLASGYYFLKINSSTSSTVHRLFLR